MARIFLLATGEKLVGYKTRGFVAVISELLQSARREIQIAVYRFDSSALPLLEMVGKAANRGVTITIIVNSMGSQPRDIRKYLDRLQSIENCKVVDFQEKSGGFLHAKVIVVDREHAVIGSANLTWGGLVTNHEIGVLIEGAETWEISHLLDRLAAP